MFVYDYPILGVFWTMLIVFLWIAWIFLLIRIFADIFRNKETGGFSKALWTIFVIFAPFLGVLVYLIVHGGDMTDRDIAQAQAHDAAFQQYVKQAAGSGTSADELTKLAALHTQGVLTDEEFAAQKARLLA